MRISKISKGYTKINRYRKIIRTLVRYGFDDLIDRLKIEHYIKFGKKFSTKKQKKDITVKLTRPQRVRMVLEELGPTFIKLGQILSMKPDIVPFEYIEEFRKLQDKAGPFPFETAKEIIEKELDSPIEKLFTEFSIEPIAAASIAQIYKAKIDEGKNVALKVQRPAIKSIITADIEILLDLARMLEARIPESELYDPVSIVEEFSEVMKKELDFINEGRNCVRFKQNFKDDPDVYIPEIYWDYSTSKVLTMEYIDGIKASDMQTIEKLKIDKNEIAVNCASAFLKQVFRFGFFHADPHPGNIMILNKNVIVFLDYGMIGRLNEEIKEQLGELAEAIVNNNIDKIVKVAFAIGSIDEEINMREFKSDIAEFIDQYYHLPVKHVNTPEIIQKGIYLFRKHKIHLPTDVVVLCKAFITSEGFVRSFAQDLDLYDLSKPYVTEMITDRFSVLKQLKKIKTILEDIAELFEILPSELKLLFLKIKRGDISLKLEHKGLDKLILELEKSSNRMTFGLIVAALIIGSSLIIQSNIGPYLFGFPILGVAGYLIAGIFGLWLIIAILRSGRL